MRGNGAYATGYTAGVVIAAIAATAASLIGQDASNAVPAVLAKTGNRLAAALLEAATLDALARQEGAPLWRYLGATRVPQIATHASIAFLALSEASDRARSATRAGFRRLKIRVGADPGTTWHELPLCGRPLWLPTSSSTRMGHGLQLRR